VKYPLYIDSAISEALEYEVVSDELMVFLTRKLEEAVFNKYSDDLCWLIKMNQMINLSRELAELPQHVLCADDWGGYPDYEQAWHLGEFNLILRRLDCSRFAEFLCTLIAKGMFSMKFLNQCMDREQASFRFVEDVELKPTIELVNVIIDSNDDLTIDRPETIGTLITRMDNCLRENDNAGVLATSSNIFETLMKIHATCDRSEGKTFNFFYRHRENVSITIPDDIWEFMNRTYIERNRTPLAGHGASIMPEICHSESVFLAECTKAIVRSILKLYRDMRTIAQ
jgi:hypothetical protein